MPIKVTSSQVVGTRATLPALLLPLWLCLWGCDSQGPVLPVGVRPDAGGPLTQRQGTVVVDGCTLDPWQSATLQSPAARRVLQDVVLLCLSMQDTGAVAPADPAARSALGKLIADLHGLHYGVRLGITATDDTGTNLSQDRIERLLQNRDLRAQATTNLATAALMADGVEIALPRLRNEDRALLIQWIGEIAAAVRPARQVGLFAPPSVTDPSDLPGGDSVDVRALAPLVDRVRVLTVDLSCCGDPPGPLTDAGWATMAGQLALGKTGKTPVDIALPLYGTDFNHTGDRSVSYVEAVGTADSYGARIVRDQSGPLHYGYNDYDSVHHDVWFEDAYSSVRTLQGLGQLPASVGVLYYGLGAEDPAFWDEEQKRLTP